ncbi:MAG: hypothetical protein K0U33_02615 [Bacteroidetes bacterium]|nr:hypothetical protein [Bacteroidota bacterium]
MKKYFTIALMAGALFSYTAVSAMSSTNSTTSTEIITKKGDKKKSKKDKKSEATKKGCEGKSAGAGCCAGKKAS